MTAKLQELVTACAQAAHEGTRPFAAIVGDLMAAGVPSYWVDHRGASTTYHLPEGGAVVLPLAMPEGPIAEAFDAPGLQEAIRASQRGELKYPQFLARAMAAGCVGYQVWLEGRHVLYFGRRGEQHLERFPSAT